MLWTAAVVYRWIVVICLAWRTKLSSCCLSTHVILNLFVLNILGISIHFSFQDADPHRSGHQNIINMSFLNILHIATLFNMLCIPSRWETPLPLKNWARNPGKIWSWSNIARGMVDFSWFSSLLLLSGRICLLITETILTTLIFRMFLF